MFSYEMDLVFEITNSSHLAIASKDRTGLFVDKPEFLISKETGMALRGWADKGRSKLDDVMDEIRNCNDLEDLKKIHINNPDLHSNTDYLASKNKKKEELSSK